MNAAFNIIEYAICKEKIKMQKYVIISDSAVDLNKEQRKEFEIEDPINGIIYLPDGRELEADLEWNNISYEEFYKMVCDKKKFVKTALPKLGTTKERFERYLKNGQDIIAITLSSGLSGTYNSFMSIAKDLLEEYPNRKIEIIDSKRYGSAIALLSIYASYNRRDGMSFDENVKNLREELVPSLHQMGILDDLYYLSRVGRISKFKATMGSLVGVKPMADFNNETGMSEVLGNGRGYKKAFEILSKYIKSTIGDASNKTVIISNSLRDEQANDIKEIVERDIKPQRIIMMRLGQSNAANVGPGLAAVYYIGNRISPNVEEEKKLFLEISSAK